MVRPILVVMVVAPQLLIVLQNLVTHVMVVACVIPEQRIRTDHVVLLHQRSRVCSRAVLPTNVDQTAAVPMCVAMDAMPCRPQDRLVVITSADLQRQLTAWVCVVVPQLVAAEVEEAVVDVSRTVPPVVVEVVMDVLELVETHAILVVEMNIQQSVALRLENPAKMKKETHGLAVSAH